MAKLKNNKTQTQSVQSEIFKKYITLKTKASNLEPVIVSMIYKAYKSKATFYPSLGIFFNEFALIYLTNK